MTALEEKLWIMLRAKRLDGAKFRRQVAIGPYIVDFVCFDARLIVEADGPVHEKDHVMERDRQRDAFLSAQGFRILRLAGDEIMGDRTMALRKISEVLRDAPG